MTLTEAYRAKRIALTYLQAKTRLRNPDLEEVERARKVYAAACKRYEQLIGGANDGQ